MKQAIFSEPFLFREYRRSKFNYSDLRAGTSRHFLAVMESGRCRIVTDDLTLEVEQGEGFYLPMGLCYQSYWYGEEIRFRSIGFAYFPEARLRRYPLQKLPQDEALFAALRAIPLTGRPDSAAVSALYAVLTGLSQRLVAEGSADSRALLDRAGSYFASHPTASVPDAARYCRVSVSSLYAAFRAAGQTPNEVRQARLCEEAVRFLTTTDRSVQSISDGLGFSSTSYFRKILQKHVGMSPREIRRQGTAL